MSRVAKTILNAKYNAIFFVLTTVLILISRKIFIERLGIEYVGLTSLLNNVMGFLALAEAGLSTSVIYHLYSPLQKDLKDQCNDILSILALYYKKIGVVILILSVVISVLFPFYFHKTSISLFLIYITFFVMVLSSITTYLFNSNQILLFADQKNFIHTKVVNSVLIIKILFQILLVSFLSKYAIYYYLLLELLSAIMTSIWLNRGIRNNYSWLSVSGQRGKLKADSYLSIVKDSRKIISHQVAGFVLLQTDQIFIFLFTTLREVTIFSNYLLLIQKAMSFVSQALNSSRAAVGILIASKDTFAIEKVFWELTILRLWISIIILFPFYIIADKFIVVWLGKDFILQPMAFIILLVNSFILLNRQTNDSFLTAYGLFRDVWAPWIEAIINIVFSILLGKYFGISGILFGTLISLIPIVVIWKPIYLYQSGFKRPYSEYFIRWTKLLCAIIPLAFLTKFVLNIIEVFFNNNWLDVLEFSFIVFILTSVLFATMLFLLDRNAKTLAKRLVVARPK